ncbi:FAD-dependent oxidoreductase [Streptomyces sp. ODS28]|uniref:FAD-dependent oxidoreductase n=1 Tax=Streptomyces sp. ODS28 TaxID=3136688 RepID=UPI0031E4E6B4
MPSAPTPPLRVAVVGSGPSGVYAAQGLVERGGELGVPVEVDVLDRLPCPYGLVRYGVAPDHEKIKSLQRNLRGVLELPGVRFLGNVQVGEGGVPPARLLELYHAVVYCVGAATDRRLGIPGEELRGSHSATEFVSWYSAHPDAARTSFGLDARQAVVIGVGNVAVDVARVLARGADDMVPTDMPARALDSLARSTVTEVTMVGRRGPSQAKFTTKELRELGALREAAVDVREDELALDPGYVDPSGLSGPARRNVGVLREWAASAECGGWGGAHGGSARRLALRFFLRPVEILDDGRGAVAGVRFERTLPEEGPDGPGSGGTGGVRGTGTYEDVPAQLVLRSVGYRGVPLQGLPFDPRTGTVPHAGGRVLRDGAPSPGEYVAGWIKRGPTGVIGTNRPCSKETVSSLLADAPELMRAAGPLERDPLPALEALNGARGGPPVDWAGWLGIEEAEAALGRGLSRNTVKIPDWEGLLTAAAAGARS